MSHTTEPRQAAGWHERGPGRACHSSASNKCHPISLQHCKHKGTCSTAETHLGGFSADSSGGVAVPGVPPGVVCPPARALLLSAGRWGAAAATMGHAASAGNCGTYCTQTTMQDNKASKRHRGLKQQQPEAHHRRPGRRQTRAGFWPRCAGSLAAPSTRSGWARPSTGAANGRRGGR